MKNYTKKIVLTSMFTALTCVATIIIRIPSPLQGYINLGDCVVLLSAFALPLGYAFLSAGIGSALADIFSGFLIYSPATFFIKGLMTIVVYLISKKCLRKIRPLFAEIIGGALAEITMVLCYYIFEGFLYGFVPSLVNIPSNCIQGLVGLIIGILLVQIAGKLNLLTNK